jgi:hypothetical protein
MVVGSVVPASQRQRVRRGCSVPALVEELSDLVARSDCRSLERDQRFWSLVRELYSRRPWSPRKPWDLVETVGVEIDDRSDAGKGVGGTAATEDSSERTAT